MRGETALYLRERYRYSQKRMEGCKKCNRLHCYLVTLKRSFFPAANLSSPVTSLFPVPYCSVRCEIPWNWSMDFRTKDFYCVYQWLYSNSDRKSNLPSGFNWGLSPCFRSKKRVLPMIHPKGVEKLVQNYALQSPRPEKKSPSSSQPISDPTRHSVKGLSKQLLWDCCNSPDSVWIIFTVCLLLVGLFLPSIRSAVFFFFPIQAIKWGPG